VSNNTLSVVCEVHDIVGLFLLLATLDGALDSGLESLGVRANDLTDLVAILEEDEGGHGSDAEFLCHFGYLIDIELVEFSVRVNVGELDDLRRNDLAGTAPYGEAVEDDDGVLVSVFDVGLEVGSSLEVMYATHPCCSLKEVSCEDWMIKLCC